MLKKDEPEFSRSGENSSKMRLCHAVMEGKGVYNKHSKIPAAGAALATRFLEKSVRNLALESGGKNSLSPKRIAIQSLRRRLGPDRPILLVHIDQPSNDFNSLFQLLSSDPTRVHFRALRVPKRPLLRTSELSTKSTRQHMSCNLRSRPLCQRTPERTGPACTLECAFEPYSIPFRLSGGRDSLREL